MEWHKTATGREYATETLTEQERASIAGLVKVYDENGNEISNEEALNNVEKVVAAKDILTGEIRRIG